MAPLPELITHKVCHRPIQPTEHRCVRREEDEVSFLCGLQVLLILLILLIVPCTLRVEASGKDRQESRCALIFDSCTSAWHTGQLTVGADEEGEDNEGRVKLRSPAEERGEEEDEDEEAAAALCCIAGDLFFVDSESLPDVFWKKSAMLAGLLWSSQGLFLDAGPDAPSLLEWLKYFDCVGLAGPPTGFVETTGRLD
ncbi:hypothetical protein EYF80_040669 [Liparis tanakae]|uniref:Uncharacterized protein n=1 Tax=Liparis tanakae TaxID=230148 RepID=A0A4Z2G6C9_9TELE|nr:hypothetical protein EYF80_040669 [Liparis tanakae]